MRRTLGLAVTGVALLASVTACDSGKKGATSTSAAPSGPASSSASAGKGAGTATVKIGSKSVNFPVTCTQNAKQTQAAGNNGSDAATLTVKGTPISAVLVERGADGSTTIYQAIEGLRDDSGKALGKITVTAGDSNSFSGTGTFVLTKLDSKGKRVKLSTGTTAQGTFQLTCSGGFAPVPTPSSAPRSTSKSTPKSTPNASPSATKSS